MLEFGFERTEYTVGEEDGSVEVCVRIRAPNDTKLINVTGVALLSTMDGTALGKCVCVCERERECVCMSVCA